MKWLHNWIKGIKSAAWPSPLNGSLTIFDSIRLMFLLLLHYPIDKKSDINSYQEAVSTAIGVKYVFAVGAGRMGLYLLLKALELKPGDEIILPGYTCVVMPNAIRFAGCKPVYVDINRNDCNIDADKIEAAITPRTRAILLQYTYGFPADISKIRQLCRKTNLLLIEDAAHALGATYENLPVGQWGDAVIFSTEASKMISTDKGGLLATNNHELALKISNLYDQLPVRSMSLEKIACIRLIYRIVQATPIFCNRIDDYLKVLVKKIGQSYSARVDLNFPGFDDEETMAELEGDFYSNYPRRMSGILCKVGLWQIKRLQHDIAHRRAKVALLEEILPEFGASLPIYDREKCGPSYLNFPILVDDREKWRKALQRLHIWANGYLRDPLEPPETRCHEINGYKWGACPNAEFVSGHILNIPLNRTMTTEMVKRLRNLSL